MGSMPDALTVNLGERSYPILFGDDLAVASTEFTRTSTERIGRQTQTWVKLACGWRIVAAHISLLG